MCCATVDSSLIFYANGYVHDALNAGGVVFFLNHRLKVKI